MQTDGQIWEGTVNWNIHKTEVHVANSTLHVQNYAVLQEEMSELFWK